MPRLIWIVLKDGRSVVAGCGTATKESVSRALSQPDRTLALTSDDGVEYLPADEVRGFVLFDAMSNIPASAAIYRFVNV